MTTGDSAVIGAINQAMLDTALANAATRVVPPHRVAPRRSSRRPVAPPASSGGAYSLDELGPDLARLNEALSDLRHEFWSTTFPRAVAKGDCLSSVNASNAYAPSSTPRRCFCAASPVLSAVMACVRLRSHATG